MWIAALPLFLRPDRRDVFPSIAMTPSSIPVIDATHAAKQLCGVQHGEDVAEMIVRGRAVTERTEAAEQVQFLGAKDGYLGDGLRPCDDRQQAEKKDFLQRIAHLALLSGIVEILEVV